MTSQLRKREGSLNKTNLTVLSSGMKESLSKTTKYEDVLHIFVSFTCLRIFLLLLVKRFRFVAFVDNKDFLKVRRGRTKFVL